MRKKIFRLQANEKSFAAERFHRMDNDTPKHRDNFIKLARAGAYDNILFHRVVRGFMVQTGDPALKPFSDVRPELNVATVAVTRAMSVSGIGS
jgi:hypothetical protein